jgi:hypothetical protein
MKTTLAQAVELNTTAPAMAWEASRTRSAERMRWAQLVLLHRVLPRDPLSAGDLPPADWTA